MRVSRQKAAENRERIIEAAGALFRAKGFGGIGVADIMKAADLTHGGFYGHFDSKDDLVGAGQPPSDGARRGELGKDRRRCAGPPLCGAAHALSVAAPSRRPGHGCVFAALGADAARSGKPVHDAFAEGLEPLIDILAKSRPRPFQGAAAPQGASPPWPSWSAP